MRLLYYSGIILFIYWFIQKYKERFITYYIGLKYFPRVKELYGKIFEKDYIIKEFEKDLKYYRIDDYFENIRIYDINEFVDFLNENYNDQYFKYEYFYWFLNLNNPISSLNKLSNNVWQYGLKVDQRLIATLVGRPSLVSVNNRILKSLYSDYLCIHKKFRKRFGLARKIQMKLCTDCIKYDFDTIIYLVDNKRIYHNTLFYIKYYILNIKKYIGDDKDNIDENDLKNIRLLNPKNIVKAYRFYNEMVKDTKKIYQIYSLEDFIQIFKPQKDISLTFYSKNSFYSLSISNFKYNNKVVKIPRLNIFLTKSFNLGKELKKLFIIIKMLDYPLIILNDSYYIDYIKWKEYLEYQGYSSFIMFNYNPKDKIGVKDYVYNFL